MGRVARWISFFPAFDARRFRGGQIATQALAGGDPPIVSVGTVIQANLTGHSLVLIAAVETKYYQVVFARPGITGLEQLKGIQFMLDMLAPQMPQAKSARPEQFVNMSFLQELEKEGFFAEMARKYPSR